MGVKGERVRQMCSCFSPTGRAMNPVKASRCTAMYEENNAFSRRLTKAEAEITALKKAADTYINSTEKTLSMPLPSDFQQDAEGNVHRIGGTGEPMISPGRLPRSKSMEFQEHVFEPISKWQTEHHRMKGRMSDLNNQSLRLDEARRRHYKKTSKHLKENVMQQDNVSAVPAGEVENPELVSARTNFQKSEAEVHAELALQGQRARDVQTYLTTAMQIQAARLNEAAAVHSAPGAGGMGMSQQGMGQQTTGTQQEPIMKQPSLKQDMMPSQPMQQQPMQANVPHLRTG